MSWDRSPVTDLGMFRQTARSRRATPTIHSASGPLRAGSPVEPRIADILRMYVLIRLSIWPVSCYRQSPLWSAKSTNSAKTRSPQLATLMAGGRPTMLDPRATPHELQLASASSRVSTRTLWQRDAAWLASPRIEGGPTNPTHNIPEVGFDANG